MLSHVWTYRNVLSLVKPPQFSHCLKWIDVTKPNNDKLNTHIFCHRLYDTCKILSKYENTTYLTWINT
jgi:hypothetical protein